MCIPMCFPSRLTSLSVDSLATKRTSITVLVNTSALEVACAIL